MAEQNRSVEDFDALYKAVVNAVEYSEEVQEILYYLYPSETKYNAVFERMTREIHQFIAKLPKGEAPQSSEDATREDKRPGSEPSSIGSKKNKEDLESYLRHQFSDEEWMKRIESGWDADQASK